MQRGVADLAHLAHRDTNSCRECRATAVVQFAPTLDTLAGKAMGLLHQPVAVEARPKPRTAVLARPLPLALPASAIYIYKHLWMETLYFWASAAAP